MKRSILSLGLLLFLSVSGWAGSLTPKGFLYKPDLGARGNTEKGLFDAGLDRIDARLAKEIWLGDPGGSPGYGTLAHALTSIGSNPTILRLPAGPIAIAENTTIPANVTLKPERGAVLIRSGGSHLTINGAFECGRYRCFNDNSPNHDWVVFGAGAVEKVHPEWWGAVGDGTTDSGPAIQAAVNSVATCSGNVHFVKGAYETSITIEWPNKVNCLGESQDETRIETNAFCPTSKIIIHLHDTVDAGVVFQDIVISGRGQAAIGIHIENCHQVFFNRVAIGGCNASTPTPSVETGKGVKITGPMISSIWFTDCIIGSVNYDGIWSTNASVSNNLHITNCIFEENTNYGLYLQNVAQSVISGNSFVSNTLDGCYVNGGYSTISNNTATSNRYGFILLGGGMSITGNVAFLNNRSGFEFCGSGSVSGCVSYNNGVSGAGFSGFEFFEGATNLLTASGCQAFDTRAVGAKTQDYGARVRYNTPVFTSGCLFYKNKVKDIYADAGSQLWPYSSPVSISTSGTGEDTLQSETIYANTLGINGRIKVKVLGTKTGAAGNKTIKFYFGTASVTLHPAANTTTNWRAEIEVENTATNAQRISYICYDGTTIAAQGYATAKEDTTANVTLKLTGECADGGDTITQTKFSIERP